MCIALISTAHPDYPLIIINNRDEFLRRPTSTVDWWPEPASHVLGSRDLARPAQGTWMGVTKHGHIAVLTNYREDIPADAVGTCSRGLIVRNWLTLPPDQRHCTQKFVEDMITSSAARNVGGFSLVCGKIHEPLAIMSNRVSHVDGITWVAKQQGETVGLSNTSFDDRSWKKILLGEKLMKEAIEEHAKAQEGEEELIQRLLHVLSTDTLPRLKEGASLETYIPLLRESIFVPVIGAQNEENRAADEVAAGDIPDKVTVAANGSTPPEQQCYMTGLYGTQKQTVVLVDKNRRVKYFERTLYDNNAKPIPVGKGDRSFEFVVEK
ncbi:hypothetical protein DTO271D3_2691 [Paecilomyces variotii]|nr:hypothetical protein DTO217A2_2472 [Paecilomyces variotii]KAJ9316952.1 hypothetical protein DTO271D3_2691 [Paecilomyces variotii]